ncbi:MAG TPA: universal stress protein [Thermodesulfobacteriota bacterium]|nr:universal stress protein [Thermodesulfobacteriota bacterium]
MNIDRIVCGANGTEDSDQAMRIAESLALKFKSHISAVSVIPDYYNAVSLFPAAEKAKFRDWVDLNLITARKDALEKVKRDLSKKGIGFDYDIMRGIPAKAISNFAAKHDADLIALGRGRSTEKTILGGTALKILRNSRVPVLTARGGRFRGGFKRIVLPVDLSHGLGKSFNYALDLAAAFGASVHVVHVVETGYQKYPPELAEQLRGFAHRELKETVGTTKLKEDLVINTVIAPNGWRGIVDFAFEKKADLIVMMTYGGGRFKKEFIGSVAEKVIQEAQCPVITMAP